MKSEWIQTVIVAMVNLLLWIIPSNVSYLIAQNRDILLGRYGMTHFTWGICLIPVSFIWLYLAWSNEKNLRKRQFQSIALVISIIIPMILVDSIMRLARPKTYVKEEHFYHRPPNIITKGTIHDVPENAFSYPKMRPGYPDINYTLTTDELGFRNKTNLTKSDIIALGDSFTEGSNVTDYDVWTTRLSQKSGFSVYNLGMAGTHPTIYMETLKQFGIDFSPKTALCMLYEGNDFRDSNYEREDSIGDKISCYFKSSPLRLAINEFLIKSLGSPKNKIATNPPASKNNNADSEKENSSYASGPLSWLPVPVPNGPNAKYYTFTVKSLWAHFVTKQSFVRSEGCKETLVCLRQIKKVCNDNHIHLIIVYAPDKSHVLTPLFIDNISAETLRDFMELKTKKLPPIETLKDTLLSLLDVEESVFREFCEDESIDFISLTKSLRERIALGEQLYFTYDDHWTPIGHEIVANTIFEFLNETPAMPQEETHNPG